MKALSTALTLAMLAGLAGCVGQSGSAASAWYDGRDAIPPRGDRIYICHAFGCALKTPVDFAGRDIAALRRILAEGRGSPAAERRAIAKAVQWQERRVGKIVGSDKDVGGLDMQNAGVPGQMDCIDEASNTTSLLLVAEARGLLRHHRVESPVARGFFLDGRYPHATAVVRETASGTAFAVDSWPEANGVEPHIKPLAAWFNDYPS
ncbi:hypothetical protein [Polymorphum gilvum]|uniref:Lipoprotein n=1 Tax=Polymorphum gilvum (strain LMG 25793 / CGMCC 1.9160 / SL003B-26A1) TaxID=991905 RepID=F2IZ19_POLGS|nr:hypothetical protein [Polymorphum gilvum]ADZ70634.1 hypothetical protein SL003B_2209 [Polymorphum gilvum SL003B-26A1]